METKQAKTEDKHTKLMRIAFTKLVTPIINSCGVVADCDTEAIAEKIFYAVDKEMFDTASERDRLKKENEELWKTEEDWVKNIQEKQALKEENERLKHSLAAVNSKQSSEIHSVKQLNSELIMLLVKFLTYQENDNLMWGDLDREAKQLLLKSSDGYTKAKD